MRNLFFTLPLLLLSACGEDDKDDNGPGAANEEDIAGEASRVVLATTPGAKKAAAVSGQPPCLALSMSGPTDSKPRMLDGTAALCAEQ
jgi:hypothetical protein